VTSVARKAWTLVLAAGIVGAIALALAGPATAKTRPVTMVMQGDPGASSATFTAKVTSSKPFGRGTLVGTFRPPWVYYTFTFKDGTFKANFKGTLDGVSVSGPWRITSGTGKYKGIKGGGRGSGDLSTGHYRFTGRVKY
jgi:hypothetical protein